jgi:hypothetical protein
MKLLGFFLMLAGWAIVLTALVVLATQGARGVFVVAGIGVEATGIVLVIRGHLGLRDLED